jgi:hypothetical protein
VATPDHTQGNSPFSYIIVDEVTHTRTILHTPAELLSPDEIDPSFLDGGTPPGSPPLHAYSTSFAVCVRACVRACVR